MGKSSITNESLKEFFVNREKIKEALKAIDELIEDYENVHKVYDVSSHTVQATMTKKTIDDLKKIRKTLEE